MKPPIAALILLSAIVLCRLAVAQELSCPQDLTWRDTTYAQRTTNLEGRKVRAAVEGDANMWTARFDEGTNSSAIIAVRRTEGEIPIALTFGKNRPAPVEFSEITMIIEPPMVDGSWSRMKKPCDIKDGSSIEFNEKDMLASTARMMAKPPVFHGVLHRRGLRFTYSVTFEANGDEPASSWQGELIYEPRTNIFDMATDMQGWHLYRGDTFVRTIPVGDSVRLSTILREFGR